MNDGNNRSTLDLTGVTKIIPKVALWFQGNVGTEEKAVTDSNSGLSERANWSGFTIQPVISITDKFSIGARWEIFEDPDGVRTAQTNPATSSNYTDVSVRNFTIAPGYKLADNVLVRVEYRYDSSNKKIWTDEDGKAKDSNSSAAAQFVVTF
jgi:opacity protein-like surface antigen